MVGWIKRYFLLTNSLESIVSSWLLLSVIFEHLIKFTTKWKCPVPYREGELCVSKRINQAIPLIQLVACSLWWFPWGDTKRSWDSLVYYSVSFCFPLHCVIAAIILSHVISVVWRELIHARGLLCLTIHANKLQRACISFCCWKKSSGKGIHAYIHTHIWIDSGIWIGGWAWSSTAATFSKGSTADESVCSSYGSERALVRPEPKRGNGDGWVLKRFYLLEKGTNCFSDLVMLKQGQNHKRLPHAFGTTP